MKIGNRCYRCLKELKASEGKSHYGLHLSCFQVWFQGALPLFESNAILPSFRSLMLQPQEDDIYQNIVLSSNFLGRYKKYSAVLGKKQYILKVQEKDYPELPATEYLCNQIAELLKIPVPNYYLVRFDQEENNLIAFVVTNFMQDLQGANLKHIYHYLQKLPEDFNCQTILKVIQSNSSKIRDKKTFIEMCLFDALIGNHDRHGRNFGFIETSKGKVLAPVYDNPSYIGIEEETFLKADLEPAGKIATKNTHNPTMKDYILEFRRLGFEKEIVNFRKRVNLEKIYSLVECAFISQNRKDALKQLINKRYRELINEN